MQIGSNIKRYRELKGLSQQKAADEIGEKRSTYAEWERGIEPKASVLVKLARLFGVNLSDLLEGVDENSSIAGHGNGHKDEYKLKYLNLLEKENEQKSRIIDINLSELVTGQRITHAHVKTLLQITVVETATMQGKDPEEALKKASKVVNDNFRAAQPGGSL
jgi:transcriptional regulator with XRE-family HTH domain